MLPLEQRQCRRQVRLVAQVDDQDVGLRRAGCASAASSEPASAGDGMPHVAQRFLELPIR